MRSSIPKSSLKAPTSPLDSSILPTGRFSQFFELLRRGIFIKGGTRSRTEQASEALTSRTAGLDRLSAGRS